MSSGLDQVLGGLLGKGGGGGASGMEDLVSGTMGGGGGGGGLGGLLKGLLGGGGGGGGGKGSTAAMAGVAAALLPMATKFLSGGGLSKLMGGFKDNGMEEQANSWVSTGKNQPITPTQAQAAMPDAVSELAKSAGISEEEASNVLSKVVPEFVNKVTPDGTLPSDADLEAAMTKLSQAGG
jgi:uncharacterized protein YidB (DUF937 family)